MTYMFRGRPAFARFLLVVTAFLAGLTAVVLPAAPAQAGPVDKICFPFQTTNGWIRICIEIPVEIDPMVLLCPKCPGILFEDVTVLPEDVEQQINQDIAGGIGLLARGDQAGALDQFTAAARSLDGNPLQVEATGVFDLELGVFERGPSPQPWLDAAAADLVDGVALLQRALVDPRNAAGWRTAAGREFDEAFAELTQRRVIGD